MRATLRCRVTTHTARVLKGCWSTLWLRSARFPGRCRDGRASRSARLNHRQSRKRPLPGTFSNPATLSDSRSLQNQERALSSCPACLLRLRTLSRASQLVQRRCGVKVVHASCQRGGTSVSSRQLARRGRFQTHYTLIERPCRLHEKARHRTEAAAWRSLGRRQCRRRP